MTTIEVLRKIYILLFVGSKLPSALQALIVALDFDVPLSKVDSYFSSVKLCVWKQQVK